jgi:hypothetical protein
MVIRPQQAWLEFAIRGDPEAVAERTELRVVEWSHYFHFSTVKTIFFPMVHAAGHDLF